MIIVPNCSYCIHNIDLKSCTAFKIIPDKYILNQELHLDSSDNKSKVKFAPIESHKDILEERFTAMYHNGVLKPEYTWN